LIATSPIPPSIHEQKDNMRKAMRAVRDSISQSARAEAAERVAAGGLADLGADIGVVAGYYPMRGEFDCLPLLAQLAASGWRTALPTVPAEDGPLEFRVWMPGAPLSQGKFRIPEPAVAAPMVLPTVVLAPLLAFDAEGHRLGYGRGYYDRTIAALRSSGIVMVIGLAFDEQEVPKVPAEQHDERLDWILSPSGAHSCGDRLLT
jgi:5-formyltetrahydrofolate cyclo-ligase